MELFGNRIVTPYAGQSQQQGIPVPATIVYREDWEESCWVLPPYQQIFPDVPNEQFPAPPPPAPVPPPIRKTDLWRAMQTWPL